MKFFSENIVIESDNMRLEIKNGVLIVYDLYNNRTVSLRGDIYKIVESVAIAVDFETGEKFYRPGVRLVDLPGIRPTFETMERKLYAIQMLNNHLMEQYLKNKTEWINKMVPELVNMKEPTEFAPSLEKREEMQIEKVMGM